MPLYQFRSLKMRRRRLLNVLRRMSGVHRNVSWRRVRDARIRNLWWWSVKDVALLWMVSRGSIDNGGIREVWVRLAVVSVSGGRSRRVVDGHIDGCLRGPRAGIR